MNPLLQKIEDISSKMIGDHSYHGKPVVLLEDAIIALEDLESQLWDIYRRTESGKTGAMRIEEFSS